MKDYLNRLLAAELSFKQLESDVLGGLDYVNFLDNSRPLEFNTKTQTYQLTVFNQRTSTDFQRISVLVNKPNVGVKTQNGTLVETQIFPYMDLSNWTPSGQVFEVRFLLRIIIVALAYILHSSSSVRHKKNFTVFNQRVQTDNSTFWY